MTKNKKKPDKDQLASERFVDFARKLVSVPKSEIDQKAAEYHKQRIAERKKAARQLPTEK